MKKIMDEALLRSYIQKHRLQSYMDMELLPAAELFVFQKDEYLVHAGEVSDYLYFMIRGEAIFFSYSTAEKNTCVNYLKGVSMIGEASSLWDRPPFLNVRAMTECTCVALSLSLYREQLLSDLTFLRYISYVMGIRLNNDARVVTSLLEPMNVRLARYILEHSPEDIFSARLTTSAAILNTSYRHLLRTLREFCEAGILQKTRRGYLLLDRNALIRILEDS